MAPFVGFALGVLFAWAAGAELNRRGTALGTRALLGAIAFGGLLFAPIAAYFLAFWPDWCFAYLIDTERLPRVLDAALVLLNAAAIPMGFLVAARSAAEHRTSTLARLAVAASLPAVVLALATFRRLTISATYAQYHGDFGIRPVVGSALGYALLWMILVLVAATTWTTRSLRLMAADSARN